jgi:hypothetical protein
VERHRKAAETAKKRTKKTRLRGTAEDWADRQEEWGTEAAMASSDGEGELSFFGVQQLLHARVLVALHCL